MNEIIIKSELKKYFDEILIDKLDFGKLQDKKDLFSCVYEQLSQKQDRKKEAQFFTHKELVNFIITHIPFTSKSCVLDPACGAGAFLAAAHNQIGINIDNIYGIDIDETALEFCRLNMEFVSQNISKNLKNTNTLKDCNLIDIFPEIAEKGGFDIIIGNPPFKNLKNGIEYDKNDSIYPEVLSGIANSATLMIAKSFEFLKEDGYLGFVLPKNITRVESFEKIREFLIKNTKLIHIYDLNHYFKDVRGDQIILIFQKKKLNEKEIKTHKVKISIHKKKGDFLNPYCYEITQSEFLKYNFIPVFYHQKIFPLYDYLLKLKPTLNEVCEGEIFRGVPLGANNELISDNATENKTIVFRGHSIRRFGIKYPLYLDHMKLNGSHKNKIERLKSNKIILQNLCSKEGGIFAALSSSDEMSLDTVTNIISTKVNLKYLLGILNSKIANFYLTHIIFLCSNFTMHTDKAYIGKIPIVLTTPEKEKTVIDIVETILKIENLNSEEFFIEYAKLNEILFDIYGLNQSQKELINEMLNETMSKRQIWQSE